MEKRGVSGGRREEGQRQGAKEGEERLEKGLGGEIAERQEP